MSKILIKRKQHRTIQLHAGKLKGKGDGVWHTKDEPNGVSTVYWCGSWHDRTAKELYDECQTIMRDLLRNHPELV